MATASQSDHGEIRGDVLYSLQRASQVLGWGPHSFRRARQNGLRCQYYGRRCFISGSELIRFLGENTKQSRPKPPRRTR